MKKICIIGNAGAGKSTLAGKIFSALKPLKVNVELVPEFIRGDIQVNGPMQSIWEQYRTRFSQKEIEDAIPNNVDYAVIDSGTLTPYFYACLYSNKENERERLVLQDMYKFFLEDLYKRRYDYVFFLPRAQTYAANPDILTDGTRYQSADEINTLETHMTLLFGNLHKLNNVHVLDCPLDQRLDKVLEIIGYKQPENTSLNPTSEKLERMGLVGRLPDNCQIVDLGDGLTK